MDGRNFFDHAVKNDLTTYDNIQKLSIGQGNDYTTGCLLDYSYFKKYYKLIAIDLSKQQKIDACPKVIQQIILMEMFIKVVIHSCFSLWKKRKKQF